MGACICSWAQPICVAKVGEFNRVKMTPGPGGLPSNSLLVSRTRTHFLASFYFSNTSTMVPFSLQQLQVHVPFKKHPIPTCKCMCERSNFTCHQKHTQKELLREKGKFLPNSAFQNVTSMLKGCKLHVTMVALHSSDTSIYCSQ